MGWGASLSAEGTSEARVGSGWGQGVALSPEILLRCCLQKWRTWQGREGGGGGMRHGVVAGAASRCPALAEMPARQRICARPPPLRRDEPEMQCRSATLQLCVAFTTAVHRLGHTARPLWPPRTAPNAYHVNSALPPRDSNMAGLPTHSGFSPVEAPRTVLSRSNQSQRASAQLGTRAFQPHQTTSGPGYIYIYICIYPGRCMR